MASKDAFKRFRETAQASGMDSEETEQVRCKKPKLADEVAEEPPRLESEELTVEVQPFEWKSSVLKESDDEDQVVIRCWCKDERGRVNLIHFVGFTYTVYLEMPSRGVDGRKLGWNMVQVNSLKKHLECSAEFEGCRPIGRHFVKKRKLYYAGSPGVRLARLQFHSEAAMKKFCKVARTRACLEHVGMVQFQVHEDNVKVLSKFLTRANIKCTQWIRVRCFRVEERDRICRDGIGEYRAMLEQVEGLDRETVLPYKVLSFDLEVYSCVENRFPTALNPRDSIFSISVVVETIRPEGSSECRDESSSRKRWVLCIGNAEAISPQQAGDEDNDSMPYAVLPCKSEKDVIARFVRLVLDEDPDVVTGHNIWGFDMKYMYMRANLVLKWKLPDMGRTKVVPHTDLTSTEGVPHYKRRRDNADFVSRTLEERMLDEEDGKEYISANASFQKNTPKTNRRLTVVDGKLTLDKPVTEADRNLERLYESERSKSEKTGRSAVYSRNKIHCFLMEGRVSLDTLAASKERRLDTYNLQNVCSTLMGKSKLDMPPAEIFRAYRIAVLDAPSTEDVMDSLACGDESDPAGSLTRFKENIYSSTASRTATWSWTSSTTSTCGQP